MGKNTGPFLVFGFDALSGWTNFSQGLASLFSGSRLGFLPLIAMFKVTL